MTETLSTLSTFTAFLWQMRLHMVIKAYLLYETPSTLITFEGFLSSVPDLVTLKANSVVRVFPQRSHVNSCFPV